MAAKKFISKIKEDKDGLYLVLPKKLLEQQGWKAGDTLQYTFDLTTNQIFISKVTKHKNKT